MRYTPISVYLFLCLWVLIYPFCIWAQGVQDACDSCDLQIQSLQQPFALGGNWLFTREDNPLNALPTTDTSAWKTIKTPGPWRKAYADEQVYSVGWYRGNLNFAPELMGEEVLLLMDTYMARMDVYLDGEKIYHRGEIDNLSRYYSAQPIPIRFKISQAKHVLAFRVNTYLMMGVYQQPFQIRKYNPTDIDITFYHLWGGEFRLLCSYLVLFWGIFFLLVYLKTDFFLYFLASLTAIVCFPLYGFPNDWLLKLFEPEYPFLLHYIGLGTSCLSHNFFAQYYYKTYYKLNWVHSIVILTLCFIFISFCFHFNLAMFQKVRLIMFFYSLSLVIHAVYMLFRAALKKKQDTLILLCGEIFLFYAGFHDMLLGLGIIDTRGLIYFGSLVATACILWVSIQSFANTFVENKKLVKDLRVKNRKIERQVSTLNQLNEVGGRLAGLLDRFHVLAEVFDTLKSQVDIERSALYLMQEHHLIFFRSFPEYVETNPHVIDLDENVLGQCAILKKIIYLPQLNQIQLSENAKNLASLVTPAEMDHGMFCVPLMDGDTVLAVLCLIIKANQFEDNSEERAIVENVCRFMAITLKNIQLIENTKKTARMESELQTAAAVQQALFPKVLPQVANLELASFFQSASETGGDWYGFVTGIPNKFFILIGDVTGHGTPAALMTATASATCKMLEELYLMDPDQASPCKFLQYLNKNIYDAGSPDFLMTFFVACIHLETGLMTFSNASHNFPLLMNQAGKIKPLLNANVRLGQRRVNDFTENAIQLQVGDQLIFYTDGLVENTNPEGLMWGDRAFRRFLMKHHEDSARDLVRHLVQTVYTYFADYPMDDDLTVVVCNVVAPFPGRSTNPNKKLDIYKKNQLTQVIQTILEK